MKSSISRSAAWLFHYAEENPDEIVAALDDKTEAVIRELEGASQNSFSIPVSQLIEDPRVLRERRNQEF